MHRIDQQKEHSILISVIIPALNEEEQIAGLIEHIKTVSETDAIEIILIDGGSEDQTARKARQKGVKVTTALQRGRAVQMNIGAEIAEGDILYFLHADTYPPKHFDRYILEAWEDGYGAGSFRLGFDETDRLLRFYCWFTRFDINAFRFGDQSLFVDSRLFGEIGGYDESLVVMEDNEIIYRLKQYAPFTVFNENVTTSARRYRRNGVIRLQLLFTLIYVLHHLGVSQEVLTDIYRTWIK